MTPRIAFASFIALALPCAGGAPLGPGDHVRSIESGGRSRSYLVHVPPGYDGRKPVPLVVALHGGATNGRVMATFSGLDAKADAAGFIVAYPDGTGLLSRLLTWNSGSCCGYARRHGTDDVSFVDAMLDDLASVARVDGKRVYATGISNGAMMAYRLACELSSRIAAIAPIAGPLDVPSCTPPRPVPVIHFHGTDDQYAPYAGGQGSRSVSGIRFQSVDTSIASWVALNGCGVRRRVEWLPDRHEDGTRVSRTTYGSCRDGAEVVLYSIEGGGHTWPGRPSRAGYLGVVTAEIDANDRMWDFFERHPMR